jgi:hypothetical protein
VPRPNPNAGAQVEAYPNQQEPILEAMQLLTPLAYDMLMFAFVQRLAADSRNKLKEDGVNIADWLQAG